MAQLQLITPIAYLKGVGSQKAALLEKELSISCVQDLLNHFPFRYIDRTFFQKINRIKPEQGAVQVLGRLVSLNILGQGRAKRLVGQLKDETGIVELVWFQGVAWTYKQLEVGRVYVVYGRASLFNLKMSISHPEMELYNPKMKGKGSSHFQPVYNSTERLKKAMLDSKGIQKLIGQMLGDLKSIDETLPKYIVDRHQLVPLDTAFRHIHFPHDAESLQRAIFRLKFEELFFMQLKILRAKVMQYNRFKGPVFKEIGQRFSNFYYNRLPFELTNAQKRVIKEIRKDTLRGHQMNRLLQGDVGSGKTIVALMAMLMALDNGYQACLMAPTEILARQHYLGIVHLLRNEPVSVGLLTGSIKGRNRKELLSHLSNGHIHILVGTHALLEDLVQFADLGIAVIDEQHRFGVEQRAKLWRKNTPVPHMLVMTATPIPRTLAMTLYGDLDISVIDALPAGRKPIKTIHMYESARLRMFGLMRDEIAKGRQVYVVYPLIEESAKLDLLYLQAGIDSLMREFPLPVYQISIVHGKLSAPEKEAEMERFVQGKTHIMVATTVIEVGVNVPNATVMIIENAERFGLSQLHQLRGRVGRGADQSYCVLMSKSDLGVEGKLRLDTMVRTNDGFEIAEVDLQLRGPGNIAGTQQSGQIDFKLVDLSVDQGLLERVRKQIMEIFESDTNLESPANALLRSYINQNTRQLSWDKIS